MMGGRRAVDDHGAAAGDRRGRGGDGRELAAGRRFCCGLQLERGRGCSLVHTVDHGLVEPHEHARGGRVDVLARRVRRQRDRQQGGQRRRAGVQLADRRPACAAVAQVRPDLYQLVGRRLAVDDRRQQRQPALALVATLNARVARDERAPALGDATVDFRMTSQTTEGGDLCSVVLDDHAAPA
jgi:hypothetical protein